MSTPIERFTETVQHYRQHRPNYPREVLSTLINECHLTRDKIIADIGSGTGILTKQLLSHGNTVYGVEPNHAMRQTAEEYLKDFAHFKSIKGSAESTTLPTQSVDIITVGTAFHWFDKIASKAEFKRILAPKGSILLVWNVRDRQSKLMRDYENVLSHYVPEYRDNMRQKFNLHDLKTFFKPATLKERTFPYRQIFDWEGFKGRLLSTSYSLRQQDPGYNDMLEDLRAVFDRYKQHGTIVFLYQTKIYFTQWN